MLVQISGSHQKNVSACKSGKISLPNSRTTRNQLCLILFNFFFHQLMILGIVFVFERFGQTFVIVNGMSSIKLASHFHKNRLITQKTKYYNINVWPCQKVVVFNLLPESRFPPQTQKENLCRIKSQSFRY